MNRSVLLSQCPMGDFHNICEPCGVSCESMACSSDLCAIGCADSRFLERQNTTYFPVDYVDKLADRRIDFSLCHEVWKSASVNLIDTTGGNSIFYIITAVLAGLINVAILIRGIYKVWCWSKQTGQVWATGSETTIGEEQTF